MKILILNWRDIKHPLAGGAEISTHEHAKGWVKAGHKVTQFSSSFLGAKPFEKLDGVQVIRRGDHYTVHLHAFFYYLKHLRDKIDLVVDEFHFIPFFTPLYVQTKKLAFIHETAEEAWFKNKPFPIGLLGYLLEPLFFKPYKKVSFMTVSDSTKKDLIKFGIKETNIHIIYNGIRVISNNHIKETRPTIIYLGKLAQDKGVEDAIVAFYKLQKRLKNSKLWVVGREEKGGYKKKVRQLAQELKLMGKIKFFDYVSEKRKFELLKKAWVLLHPSIREGWGLTVIEAASQDTPTVAYNTVGLCDSIKNNNTGFLIDNRKPEYLAEKILLLCQDNLLYKQLSENARKWSENFNWKRSVKQSLRLIENSI